MLLQACGKKPVQVFGEGCLEMLLSCGSCSACSGTTLSPCSPELRGLKWQAKKRQMEPGPASETQFSGLNRPAFEALPFILFVSQALQLQHHIFGVWERPCWETMSQKHFPCSLDLSLCDSPLCQPLLLRLGFNSYLLYFCQTPASVQPYFNIWKNICCSAVAICFHPQEARPKIPRDFEEQC